MFLSERTRTPPCSRFVRLSVCRASAVRRTNCRNYKATASGSVRVHPNATGRDAIAGDWFTKLECCVLTAPVLEKCTIRDIFRLRSQSESDLDTACTPRDEQPRSEMAANRQRA